MQLHFTPFISYGGQRTADSSQRKAVNVMYQDSKAKRKAPRVRSLFLMEAVPGVEHGDKGLAGPMPWRLATPP